MEMRRGSGDGMGWNGLSGTDDVDDRTWSTNLWKWNWDWKWK